MFNVSSKNGDISEVIFSGNRTSRLIEARKNIEDLEIIVTRMSDLAVHQV